MPLMQRPGIDHDPIKPFQWATYGIGHLVEILSYPIKHPYCEEDTIMIRTTVGDPTTLREVPLRRVAVFSPDRHEDFGKYPGAGV